MEDSFMFLTCLHFGLANIKILALQRANVNALAVWVLNKKIHRQ